MPDAAVAEPTAAPLDAAPDAEQMDAPMFAPPAEDAPPGPEVPAAPVPYIPSPEELAAALSGLGDDELEKLAPVTSLVARKNESVRRKTEHEAATKRYTEEQQYAGSDAVISDLTEIARAAAENADEYGRPVVDPKSVGKATTAVLARGVAVGINMLSQLLEEQSGADFTLTKAETDGIAAAQVLYHRNPLDPTPLYRAFMSPFVRSQTEVQRAELRAELTPVIRREEQDRIRAATAAAAGESRTATAPTALNGASPSTAPARADMTTFVGISAALRAGLATDAQAREAYAKLN